MHLITISKYNQKVLFAYFLFILHLFNLSQQTVPNSKWHNKVLYNTAQELLDSVPNVNYRQQNVAAAPINVDFVKKWLHKYIVEFVCHKTYQTSFVALKQFNVMNAKFRENYANVQSNFCIELKSGKSIEEATASIQNEVVKLIKNFADDANNQTIIDQKALKNLFPNNLQQEQMERLMEQFHLALHSFIESIKAKTSASPSSIFWVHRNNGFNVQQHHSMAQQQLQRRRRRKSMKTFDGITQGGGGGGGGGEAATSIPALCILFVLLAMAALVGLIVALGVPSLDHHAKLPIIIISVVVLVFNLALLCTMCNLPE